jgi:serine protease
MIWLKFGVVVRISTVSELLRLSPMRYIKKPLGGNSLATVFALALCCAASAATEFNPVRSHAVELGPEASRLIIGLRATSANSVTTVIRSRVKSQVIRVTQAQTSRADIVSLTVRTGVAMRTSRQFSPDMHVIFLARTLYGADVAATLDKLRADPTVAFADIDGHRYPHALPNDPLFVPTATASGQWFMQTPSSLTPTSDAAATDAVSAWNLTQGSTGTVIADVDSGIRFDHPDLLRAGLGGRLLPGYDFVGQDLDASNSAPLGTFLIANDGDGWDPDPSDPGDWIDSGDLANTKVFPSANCSTENSSWHGTRVMGVLGALTNNDTGIAGMSWNPYLLPVRSLGKCGGLDSDIIAGIMWSAGMTVVDDQGNAVPANPYPADIINLSLGGSATTCPSSYSTLINQLAGMHVLLVVSAGNESGPVDTPANCPGVLAVAGLRNVGTKVGYSSLGPQVGIAAPAGNCVNTLAGSPCLRSIDTTTNDGATTPGGSSYTNQTNSNLGTSFSAPIVSGVAALMRSVNANLTPAQLIARMKSSATPFPLASSFPPAVPTLAACDSGSSSNVECACTTITCGAGMVNALSAVTAALNPIAAVRVPAGFTNGTLDASGSMAACGATVTTYAWTATGAVHVASGAASSSVNVTSTGIGILTLVVTDSVGKTDRATVIFNSHSAVTTAPSSAGSSASACVTPLTISVVSPTVAEGFAPTSVQVDASAVLTVTLSNGNPFTLTQSGITLSLPSALSLLTTPAPATTCTGASMTLGSGTDSVTLSNANIPAEGSCDITLSVKSATAGSYSHSIAANDLLTGPAGSNGAPASASLTVTGASSSSGTSTGGGGGGGGDLDVWDILLVTGVFLAIRGHAGRRTRR